MIQSSRVTARIKELLKLSGVSSNDALEEMTDHYLSQIENLVDSGISQQSAIRQTYKKIANTDLTPINEPSNKKWYFIIGIAALMLIFILNKQKCTQNLDSQFVKAESSIEVKNTDPVGWPIEGEIHKISSQYGPRLHPVQKTKSFHKGIDIRASKGTNVIATADGKIIKAEYNRAYGNFVIISHSKGYSTKYAHLEDYTVEVDQEVKIGEIIGHVGSTGKSTAPHLHYEIIKNKKPVDPMSLIAP